MGAFLYFSGAFDHKAFMRDRVKPAGLFRDAMVEHISQWHQGVSSQLADINPKKSTTDNQSELLEIIIRKPLELRTNVTNRLVITSHVGHFCLNLFQKRRPLQVVELIGFEVNRKSVKALG